MLGRLGRLLVLTVLLLLCPMAPLCCVPRVVLCPFPDILDTTTAVQVLCSNPLCCQSGLVHPGCYYRWENKVVSFLTSGGRGESSSVDSWMKSSLCTSQMWDHPLPGSLTACKCELGSLKRRFGTKEHDLRGDCVESCGPALEEEEVVDGDLRRNDIQSGKESSEEKWEFVSRTKLKKSVIKHRSIIPTRPKNDSKLKNQIAIQETGNKTIKKKASSLFLTKGLAAASPKTGPDPLQNVTIPGYPLHMTSSMAEGKRDSSGLIHCCSCHTVHVSLPHFIQHCKTEQHGRSQDKAGVESTEFEEVNNNRGGGDVLGKEVQQLKRCLLELMKQRLEQENLDSDSYGELRDNFQAELKMNNGALAVLAVKVQEMEGEIFEMKKKMSSCSLTIENNEKDLDSCYECFQDLVRKFEDLTKTLRAIENRNVDGQNNLKNICEEVNQDREESKLLNNEVPIRWVTLLVLIVVIVIISLVENLF